MKSPRERFEENVEPEPNTGCHLWTGSTGSTGYGCFWMNGKLHKAQRAAYQLYVGEIPDGACVLHRCDVRLCVNVAHLFLGDRQANQLDMAMKARGKRSRKGLPYGVYECCGRYGTQVGYRKRRHNFGTYDTPEEAHAAAIAGRNALWENS